MPDVIADVDSSFYKEVHTLTNVIGEKCIQVL